MEADESVQPAGTSAPPAPGRILAATSRSASKPLRLVELPARRLGARDVRVRVRAIGVNPVDWKMREGGPLRFAHRFLGPSGPFVVGVDFAGEVIEAGPRADLTAGTRVVGGTDFSRGQRGSYATEVVVRDDQCAVLPDAVSFEDAACLPVAGVTALVSLRYGSIPSLAADAKLLVLGASGGVGLTALQLARAMGAKTVGVCSNRNIVLVERYGAVAVDYTRGDALAAARAHGPFDLVIHAVGTAAAYPLAGCRSLLSRRGLVVLVVPGPRDYLAVAFRRNVRQVLGRPRRVTLEPLVQAVHRGELECIVEARFPLAEAEKALAVSKAGKVVGKLVLLP